MKYLSLILLIVFVGCNDNPKIGETWRYEPRKKTENPFITDKPIYTDYKVLDISGDYIKYMDMDSNIGTSSIHWFLIESHKIKSANCDCK